jgi:membrane fusion protein, copper/silver efflux system
MRHVQPMLMTKGAPLILAGTLLLAGCGDGHEDPGDHQAPADPHAEHGPAPARDVQTQDHGDGTVHIEDDLARRLGVTLTEARVEDLERTVRATGEVVWDETRLATVSLRFGGWAERLHVDFTGRHVRVGEPLLAVYSPELVSAQEDLLAAVRLARELSGSRVPESAARGEEVLDAARERLRLWGISSEDIHRVEEEGRAREHLTLVSPHGGYVVEKNIQAGERFEAGAPLYRLADLSRVWVEVEVYERDLPWMAMGGEVEVEAAGDPGARLQGRITYIYPDVDRTRRTARVRIELPNPGERLRPGMFATARARVAVARAAVTVPRDAVMHTGERALVFVYHGNGRYETRPVELGAEAGDRVQIRSGLDAEEQVVARAGFILDAESRLMEAMIGQPGMPGMEMDEHGTDGHGGGVSADPHAQHDHGGPDA